MTLSNSTPRLPYKAGGFKTLSAALDYAAQGHTGMRFYDLNGAVTCECSFSELRTRALQTALVLQSYNFPRGSRIAVLAQTRVEFHILFFACQYLGLLPCPVPYTVLPASQQIYQDQLAHLLQVAKATLLVTPESMLTIAQGATSGQSIEVISFEALSVKANSIEESAVLNNQLHPLQIDEDAFVQFSSGSTSKPTGIVISQKAVIANLDCIAQKGTQVLGSDVVFCWLPFHHDMGLVGFILSPVNTQSPIDYIAPATFSRNPALWLKLMSKNRSSITFAPGFAYALAAQHTPNIADLDLSSLRVAGVGGDMVHAQTLRDFAQSMAPTGFRFDAFCPCYGLAEATLAVTMTTPAMPPYIRQFSESGHTKELVSCGIPLPGYDVKIVHAQKSVSTAHEVGEIWVKGPSIVVTTQTTIPELQGFLRTGDLGFMHEGHLFITGRVKDLIIIRGRNIWAQDVEWALAASHKELHEQNLTAIGVQGNNEEHLVVIVENIFPDDTHQTQAQQKMQSVVNQTFGVTAQFVWVKPKSLVVTASGKLARSEIKTRYLNNALSICKTDN